MPLNYIIKSNSRISEVMPFLLEQLKQNNWFIKYNDYSVVCASRRKNPEVLCQFDLEVDLSSSMGIHVKCHVDIGRWHHTPKNDSRFRPAMERELNKIELLRKK